MDIDRPRQSLAKVRRKLTIRSRFDPRLQHDRANTYRVRTMVNLNLAQSRAGWKVLTQRIAHLPLCDRLERNSTQTGPQGNGQDPDRDGEQHELPAGMVR
jgi:hypothetical protein